MNGLRPGDVLTNLACQCGRGCNAEKKILVLARAGKDHLEFSRPSDDITIVSDRSGPWRWREHDLGFINKEEEQHPLIGDEVEVLEGAGLRELQWYRELPNPSLARFRIDPRKALGTFEEPSTLAKLEAIINRSDDNEGFARGLQLAVDLIFAGSTDAIDERRMRYLVTLMHSVGQMLARNSSREPGIEDLLGSMLGGGLPPELRAAMGGLFSQSRRERGGDSERRDRRDPRHASNGAAHHG